MELAVKWVYAAGSTMTEPWHDNLASPRSALDKGQVNVLTGIEPAERDVMSKCLVPSTGRPLSSVSRHSMSPYFFIKGISAKLRAD